VIQHIKEEDADGYSDDSLFSISSWGADLSFRELIERYDEDALVKPELQRHYVWDRIEASRFVDSLLLGLPVPSIFLAQTEDEKLLIVDGYQRIMTVRDFVRGVFSGDGRAFRLSRSQKINARWRGKTFAELDEAEQRRIRNTTIHAIIFVQKQPQQDDTSLFQVFERINTSGRTLLPQEIRNCVAQGSLNRLLLILNQDEVWRTLFGLRAPEHRMRDVEFILRFFALSSPDYRAGKTERLSLKQFLNQFMKRHKALNEAGLAEFESRFRASIRVVYGAFGPTAFHNISPSSPEKLVSKFSPTLCDSLLIAADYASRGEMRLPDDPEANRRQLLQDANYRFAITKETMSRTCINTRISMAAERLFGARREQ
jgi:hypothetical protein